MHPPNINDLMSDESKRHQVLLELLARDAYRLGEFTLSSGLQSKHYINCKPVSLNGIGLSLLSVEILAHIEENAAAVAGLTLGADPLVSGVALMAALKGKSLDALIIRKEPKGHGTAAWLEGPLPESSSIITVLEDVITTGGSALKAVRLLRESGFIVNRVISIIDRQEGGKEALAKENLEVISLFQLSDIISYIK